MNIDKGYANGQLLVGPEWLEAYLGDAGQRIVDLRPPILYQRGHIPGAANMDISLLQTVQDGVPEMALPPEEGSRVFGSLGIDRNTRVIAYDNVGGLVAARLFWILEYYGHEDVRVLDGGSDRWIKEGRALTREASAVESHEFITQPRPEVIVDRQWILQNRARPELVLVDTRSPKEFEMSGWGQGLEDGHLPGAVNLEWSEVLEYQPFPVFKPAEEVQPLFQERGVDREKDVVTYCQTGARSAHTYFVLRLLGYPRVRHYDGSWVDWVIRTRHGG